MGLIIRSRASLSATVGKWLAAAVARLLFLAALCAVSAALLALVSWIDPQAKRHGGAASHVTRGVELPEAQHREEAVRAVWEMAGADRRTAERLRLGLVIPEVVSWEPRVILLKSFLSWQVGSVTGHPISPALCADQRFRPPICTDLRFRQSIYFRH
ncbi:unnamed protein product [Closterium sp. NIES-53]